MGRNSILYTKPSHELKHEFIDIINMMHSYRESYLVYDISRHVINYTNDIITTEDYIRNFSNSTIKIDLNYDHRNPSSDHVYKTIEYLTYAAKRHKVTFIFTIEGTIPHRILALVDTAVEINVLYKSTKILKDRYDNINNIYDKIINRYYTLKELIDTKKHNNDLYNIN